MAYILIFLAVLIYALYPSALLQFVSEYIDILTYLIIFQVVAATFRIFMALYYNTRVFPKLTGLDLRLIDPRIVNRETLKIGVVNAVFDNLAFGSFFFALYFGSAIQASVFYELWASVFLLLTMYLRRNQPGQYEHLHGKLNTALFFTVGIIGIVLVVSSSAHNETAISSSVSDQYGILVTIAAIASPILMAVSFFIGTKNARLISSILRTTYYKENVEDDLSVDKSIDTVAGIYHGVFLRVIGTILLSGLLLALYLLNIWEPDFTQTNIWVLLGIILCALISASGGALADISNNISKTSNLNQFWSFTPFLAVIFLNVFGFTDDTSRGLYFGAILILSSNYILLNKNSYSQSFLISILFLCFVYYLILFVPPVTQTSGLQHMTIPLGIFGIFAAFFIDRIMRSHESANSEDEATVNLTTNSSLFSHNVFILWILGFGSVVALILFRPETSVAIEFVSAFVSMAVIYICLLPIEFIAGKEREVVLQETGEPRDENRVLPLVMSALFISLLFVLYLLALLEQA